MRKVTRILKKGGCNKGNNGRTKMTRMTGERWRKTLKEIREQDGWIMLMDDIREHRKNGWRKRGYNNGLPRLVLEEASGID